VAESDNLFRTTRYFKPEEAICCLLAKVVTKVDTEIAQNFL